MDKTLDYYNTHAASYAADSRAIDCRRLGDHFLAMLPHAGRILDFGCGSGRDLKYFRERGYRAEGSDGSDRMCHLASQYTGTKVRRLKFQSLDDIQSFDGIWACSSIMHLNNGTLPYVLNRMSDALVDNGLIYTSFRCGESEGECEDGRYFNEMTEPKFRSVLERVPDLRIIECWCANDPDASHKGVSWFNLVLRKN